MNHVVIYSRGPEHFLLKARIRNLSTEECADIVLKRFFLSETSYLSPDQPGDSSRDILINPLLGGHFKPFQKGHFFTIPTRTPAELPGVGSFDYRRFGGRIPGFPQVDRGTAAPFLLFSI